MEKNYVVDNLEYTKLVLLCQFHYFVKAFNLSHVPFAYGY